MSSQPRWFQLLRGIHSEHGHTYIPPIIDQETLEETPQADGQYVYSVAELLRFNPRRGGPNRFRLLQPGEVADLGLVPPSDLPFLLKESTTRKKPSKKDEVQETAEV